MTKMISPNPFEGTTGDFKKFVEVFQKYNNYDLQQGLILKDQDNDTNDTLVYELTIADKHLSSPNICHGGVISGMMDATLGLASIKAAIKHGKIVSTVEFKINYFEPACLGDTLRGIGKIEFYGKSLIVASAEILNIKTKALIAKGMGTFNLYPLTKRVKSHEHP